MATSPVPQWAREMSPTHTGPTGGGVLRLAVLVLVVVICWQWFTRPHFSPIASASPLSGAGLFYRW